VECEIRLGLGGKKGQTPANGLAQKKLRATQQQQDWKGGKRNREGGKKKKNPFPGLL